MMTYYDSLTDCYNTVKQSWFGDKCLGHTSFLFCFTRSDQTWAKSGSFWFSLGWYVAKVLPAWRLRSGKQEWAAQVPSFHVVCGPDEGVWYNFAIREAGKYYLKSLDEVFLLPIQSYLYKTKNPKTQKTHWTIILLYYNYYSAKEHKDTEYKLHFYKVYLKFVFQQMPSTQCHLHGNILFLGEIKDNFPASAGW